MPFSRAMLVMLGVVVACKRAPSADTDRLTVWHTFGPAQTAALNDAMAAYTEAEVTSIVLPFGRAQERVEATLQRQADCPDLVRLDATWLPRLAESERLVAAPEAELAGFTPQALELATWQGRVYGLPQSIDGLALLYEPRAIEAANVPWPPTTLEALEHAVARLAVTHRHGFSARADGYWFTAWLRAAGGRLLDADGVHIAEPAAQEALERYARLIEDGLAFVPPAGDEAQAEARRFARGELPLLVGGPWTLAELGTAAGRVKVAPYPLAPDGSAAAPRGGHVWAVPRCSRHHEAAWRLARFLTGEDLQVRWSALGSVPTRTAALARAHDSARQFARALVATRPLPRHVLMPLLFDDLTPAVEAVLAGEATADEALAGTRRGWIRLMEPSP